MSNRSSFREDVSVILSTIRRNTNLTVKDLVLAIGNFEQSNSEQDQRQISIIADSVLITKDGKCNWDNINTLKRLGWRVTPGERDGFGWLTGLIWTIHGQVLFG